VPVDSNQGALDITDKELRRRFNKILDKGSFLTVIFDSCHSGSIARGLPQPFAARFLPPDPRDVADGTDPGPQPEERGALVLSAAQDFESAWEAQDEEGNPRGAFSLALATVLRTAPIDEPAEHVYLRVKALMQTDGRKQEPILAGSGERRRMPLFGNRLSDSSEKITVAVLKVEKDGTIELQGGWAVGLREESELKKAGGAAGQEEIKVRIVRVDGLSLSKAELVKGERGLIRSGDLFELDQWSPPHRANLRVLIPSPLPYEEVSRIVQEMSTLRAFNRIQSIDDPTEETPTHVMSWNGSGWDLSSLAGKVVNLGMTPTAQTVLEVLITEITDRIKFFLYLPPPVELAGALQLSASMRDSSVEKVSSAAAAHYLLVGRPKGEALEYTWLMPNVTRNAWQTSLPVRADWVGLNEARASIEKAGRALDDLTLRLAKIRAWLTFEAPPDNTRFPYRLALKNAQTGEIKTSGKLFTGEVYGLVLQADVTRWLKPAEKRYVYVFSIDSKGHSKLLFPSIFQGNVENRVPYSIAQLPAEIILGSKESFEIAPPLGIDTYILLTSEEPIPNPQVLEFEGVRRGNLPQGDGSPLQRLLEQIGWESRGQKLRTPLNWSIQRLSFESAESKLHQIVQDYRKIIVLLDGEASFTEKEKTRYTAVARKIYHQKLALLDEVFQSLAEEFRQAVSTQFREAPKNLKEFLRYASSHETLHDADRLAFFDLVEELFSLVEEESRLSGEVVLQWKEALQKLSDELKSIKSIYQKELSQIFSRFAPRGEAPKREKWGDYVVFLKRLMTREQILLEYPQESWEKGEERPRGKKQDETAEIYGTNFPSKAILLTFDDGPHRLYTHKILELLQNHKIGACFFQVGRILGKVDEQGNVQLSSMATISKKIIEAGHTLANHSYSHPLLPPLPTEKRMQEIAWTSLLIAEIGGRKPNLFRPPYGAKSRDLLEELQSQGMRSIMWNIDSLDWADPIPESVADRVFQRVRETQRGILLFHDIHSQSVAALPLIIGELLKDGYTFLACKDDQLVPSQP
ncbi:MAG: polysaccharide deacetylase family protein, partial [Candidatus Tectomicrobia bacterium]|nr:polysaccharide deacetylase family protein [Candidatus Tectomicrobia bacterium]